MPESAFVLAVGPDGQKRRVPRHYLDNKRFGYKLPPSARRGAATPATSTYETEPATPEKTEAPE